RRGALVGRGRAVLSWRCAIFGSESRGFGSGLRDFRLELRGLWSWSRAFGSGLRDFRLKLRGFLVEPRGLWGWSRAVLGRGRAIDFTFKSDNLSSDSRQQNMKFANPDRASLPLVFDHSLIQFSPSRPRIFQSRTVLDAIMPLLHPRFSIKSHP